MRRLRRCKIVATLGPASCDHTTLVDLYRAGADLFRINMSHADHAAMRDRVQMIRDVEKEVGRPIGILLDLQGPKLRIGEFADGGAYLTKGAEFTLDLDPAPGNAERVRLPHPEILSALHPGNTVLVDDGKVRLHIIEASREKAKAIVDVPGKISNRNGVRLRDTEIPATSMTEKDRADLDAGLNEGVDWVAVSFVQRPDDIAEVRKVARGRALVMAKIEKPQAINRLDE